jgi:ribosomal-protein-alanine N-acetyltransferase
MSANLLEHIIYSDAKLSDLDNIFKVESKSYDNPWTIGILRDCLVNHYDFYKAEYNNNLIGYIIAKISIHETHILNLTISEDYRNRGIATELLEMIFSKCYIVNSLNIFLETRVNNTPAIKLYEKHNFRRISIRKNYYQTSDGKQDAIIFKKILS